MTQIRAGAPSTQLQWSLKVNSPKSSLRARRVHHHHHHHPGAGTCGSGLSCPSQNPLPLWSSSSPRLSAPLNVSVPQTQNEVIQAFHRVQLQVRALALPFFRYLTITWGSDGHQPCLRQTGAHSQGRLQHSELFQPQLPWLLTRFPCFTTSPCGIILANASWCLLPS